MPARIPLACRRREDQLPTSAQEIHDEDSPYAPSGSILLLPRRLYPRHGVSLLIERTKADSLRGDPRRQHSAAEEQRYEVD